MKVFLYLYLPLILAFVAVRAESVMPQRAYFGTNLSGPSPWTSSLSFVDVMKFSGRWKDPESPKIWENLDPHGYPILKEGEVVESVVLNNYHPKGKYVLQYVGGDAAPELWVDGKQVQEIEKQSPGRLEFQWQGGKFLSLRLKGGSVPISSLKLWMPGMEGAKSPWNPAWVKGLNKYSVLRFMDLLQTNRSPMRTVADLPSKEDVSFVRRGVPVELLVNLANEVQAEPWICIPHMADDELVRSFATTTLKNLRTDGKVYVEYSNEVFNQAFAQFAYAVEQGKGRGYTEGVENDKMIAGRFAMRRTQEIVTIWKEVFGPRADDVMGVFTFGVRKEGNYKIAVDAVRFAEDGGKYIDFVSFAPYIGVGISRKINLPIQQWTVEKTLDGLFEDQKNQIRIEMKRAAEVAKIAGKPLIAYEGGQHLSLFGDSGAGKTPEDKEHFARIILEVNQHPRMEELYRMHLTDWFEGGGNLYCQWTYMTNPSVWGSWGLQTHIDEPLEHAPKLRAVLEFMKMPSLPVKK